MAVKRIGLLGGSFDPVHKAHIELAETAIATLSLDQLQIIPAANPWQRSPLIATPQQRLEMLELACAHNDRIVVNPSEIERGGKTYTIDTINELAPDANYYWLLGSDQLENFCTWHRWSDIARKVILVVARRPNSSAQIPDRLAKHLKRLERTVIELPFTPSNISATQIRGNLAHNLPVDDMLDANVHNYITRHRLYLPKPTSS